MFCSLLIKFPSQAELSRFPQNKYRFCESVLVFCWSFFRRSTWKCSRGVIKIDYHRLEGPPNNEYSPRCFETLDVGFLSATGKTGYSNTWVYGILDFEDNIFGGQKVVKDTQVACPANMPAKSPCLAFRVRKSYLLPTKMLPEAIKKTQDLASHLQKLTVS